MMEKNLPLMVLDSFQQEGSLKVSLEVLHPSVLHPSVLHSLVVTIKAHHHSVQSMRLQLVFPLQVKMTGAASLDISLMA